MVICIYISSKIHFISGNALVLCYLSVIVRGIGHVAAATAMAEHPLVY